MKSGRWIILTILFFILICSYLNSTSWFRLKLANYYTRFQSYDNSITLYKKILRKESLNSSYRKSESGNSVKTNYITLLLTNGYSNNVKYHLSLYNHYSKPNTLNLQLLDKAMVEYRKITELYEDYQNIFKPISYEVNKKWEEIFKEMNFKKTEACFKFGKEYIKKEMWKEAKYFFTKIILKYMHPIDVLTELNRLYNVDGLSEIRQKIWGDEIFVALEDFEDTTRPILIDWVRSEKPKVNSHTIVSGVSRSGHHSEYFDLSYIKTGGYHYWVKPVAIPLTNPNLRLGVRVFIKSGEPFKGNLRFNVFYPKPGVTGVWDTDIKRSSVAGWEEHRIEDLFQKTKLIASQQNCGDSEMVIDRIILDTHGFSNKFHVDDVELYIMSVRNQVPFKC